MLDLTRKIDYDDMSCALSTARKTMKNAEEDFISQFQDEEKKTSTMRKSGENWQHFKILCMQKKNVQSETPWGFVETENKKKNLQTCKSSS